MILLKIINDLLFYFEIESMKFIYECKILRKVVKE